MFTTKHFLTQKYFFRVVHIMFVLHETKEEGNLKKELRQTFTLRQSYKRHLVVKKTRFEL